MGSQYKMQDPRLGKELMSELIYLRYEMIGNRYKNDYVNILTDVRNGDNETALIKLQRLTVLVHEKKLNNKLCGLVAAFKQLPQQNIIH